jgi:hypothetical protein
MAGIGGFCVTVLFLASLPVQWIQLKLFTARIA